MRHAKPLHVIRTYISAHQIADQQNIAISFPYLGLLDAVRLRISAHNV